MHTGDQHLTMQAKSARDMRFVNVEARAGLGAKRQQELNLILLPETQICSAEGSAHSHDLCNWVNEDFAVSKLALHGNLPSGLCLAVLLLCYHAAAQASHRVTSHCYEASRL